MNGNDTAEPTTDDLVSSVASRRVSASAAAVGHIDSNPDDAAEAIRLWHITGAPSAAIFGDLPEFKSHIRAQMAGEIVRGNPIIADYIASHPLAAAVSADDYSNLDRFSRVASATSALMKSMPDYIQESLSSLRPGTIIGAIGAAAKETITEAPELYAAGAAEFPSEGRGLTGALERTIGAPAAGIATAILASPPAQAAFDIGASTGFAPLEIGSKFWLGVRLWIDSKLEPPAGIHPAIDAIKAAANTAGVSRLEADLAAAQASLTRTRSPEMFGNFVDRHYGDAAIGVHGDAVAALYGDRAPTPGDGLLGWVPRIADQIALARETGADVQVPVRGLIANISPDTFKQLRPDIRAWPGGITEREAAAPIDPRPMVDAPMPQLRGASGLEPLFSMGDRKLTLQPLSIQERLGRVGIDWDSLGPRDREFYADNLSRGPDNLKIISDSGEETGRAIISKDPSAKQLKVDFIESEAGPNSFGPSLVMDLKRQLKDMYPGFETITGERIGRETEPIVRLADPSPRGFQDVLDGSWRKFLSGGLEAQIKPTDLYTEQEERLDHAVRAELERIAGPGVEPIAAQAIRYSGPGPVRGAFVQFHQKLPAILYDLLGPDAIGVARHEAVHYLRNYGFFTDSEWLALSRKALAEDWIGRYNINDRYPTVPQGVRLEESIAEGYRAWVRDREIRAAVAEGDPLIHRAFDKLSQLWQGLRERFNELLSGEPSADRLFQRVHAGEIASREPAGPWRPGLPVRLAADEAKPAGTPATAGLTSASFRRLQEQISQRYASDLEASETRAARDQSRRQTKEWRDNRAALRPEVAASIQQRPDVAADLFLGSGELGGQKLRQRYTLRAGDLTAEQRAALPSHYVSVRGGLPINAVAHMFGFRSGDELVAGLSAYRAEASGPARNLFNGLVDAETDRQMEQRYGQLGDNIMDAAKDQALSENDLNLLAEEYHAAGLSAGRPTIDKDAIRSWAREQFAQTTTVGSVSSTRALAETARHYRAAVDSLIAERPAEALLSLQRRYLNAILASEAKRFEREIGAFDKVASRLSQRTPAGIEPTYTNFIHQVLGAIGKPVSRSIQDLATDMAARGTRSLEDFALGKAADDFRFIPIAEELLDPTWRKPYRDLTVNEFRNIRDTIGALAHEGRDELRIGKAGETADLAEIKAQMVAQIQINPLKDYDGVAKRWLGPIPPFIATPLRTVIAEHIQTETLLNRIDRGNAWGPFNQYVLRDLFDGANQADAWKKEFAAKLRAAEDGANLSAAIDNPIFRSPRSGQLIELNRANLRTIMLNAGTNLRQMAVGYKLEPQQVMDWINAHADRSDWDYVQKIWATSREAGAREGTMYRSLTGGVAPQLLEGRILETPFGRIQGEYYPIIFHPDYEGASKKLMGGDPLDPYMPRTLPAAGHTKSRTGYIAPLALDMEAFSSRLAQVINNTALRPALIDAQKIFKDHTIREEIAARYGQQYRDGLVDYLRGVSGVVGYESKNSWQLLRSMEFLRKNLLSTLIGLNPSTVFKHLPTAWVLSMQEVGPINFLNAVKDMFSVNAEIGERNWQFANNNSLELQRRDRNWAETLTGVTQPLKPVGKLQGFQQNIIQYSSKPVAYSDLISARPTWLAQFGGAIREGRSFGDAVYAADRAVRRAHGSSAVTSRPGIVRNTNPWLTGFYTTFSNLMNRMAELVWDAGDTLDLVKSSQFADAAARIPQLAGQLFAVVLWPAIVEELVSPLATKEHESLGRRGAKALAYTAGSYFIGLRDIVHYVLAGNNPTVGLLGTAAGAVGDIAKDLRKDQPLSRDHAQRLIIDAGMLTGLLTGVPEQFAKSGAFAYGVHTRMEQPKGPWGWMTGLRFGTLRSHSRTFREYHKEIAGQ